MFGFKKIFKFAAVTAAALMVLACAEEKKNVQVSVATKGNMIPDDALFAVKIQPEQIWDKAMGSDYSPASRMWNDVKGELLDKLNETREAEAIAAIVRDAIKDPATLGISLKEPLVASVSGDFANITKGKFVAEVSLVALLDDRDAFIDVVNTVVDLANERARVGITKESVNDTYVYYSIAAERNAALDLSISKESAVLRMTVAEHAEMGDLKDSMLGLFLNGGPKNNEGMKAFYDAKSDVAVWGDLQGVLDVVMTVIEKEEPAVYAQLESSMPDYSGAAVVADLEFKDGQTVLDLRMFGSEEMKANALKYNTASSDKFFQYVPASSVFVGNFAIKDFAGLVEEISNVNEEVGEQLDLLMKMLNIDDEFLAGFPGVITFAVSGQDIDTLEVPHFFVGMECDRQVWDFLVDNVLSECAEDLGADIYCVENEFCFWYYDGAIMIFDINCPSGGFDYTDLAADIEDGGFVFNVAALPDHLLDRAAKEVDYYMTGRELLEYFSSIVITPSSDFMSATVTLNMGDNEHNLLEKILNCAANEFYFGWR